MGFRFGFGSGLKPSPKPKDPKKLKRYRLLLVDNATGHNIKKETKAKLTTRSF